MGRGMGRRGQGPPGERGRDVERGGRPVDRRRGKAASSTADQDHTDAFSSAYNLASPHLILNPNLRPPSPLMEA